MNEDNEIYENGGEEEVIREGSWICPFCNMKNKGSHIKCSGCGQARGEVEFIYEEDGEVSEDGNMGPDWVCAYCGFSNPFNTEVCNQCGAGKSEGKNREVKDIDFKNQKKSDSPPVTHSTPAVRKPPSKMGKYIAIILILLIAGAIYVGTKSYNLNLVVKELNWNRSIDVDEFKPVIKEGWQDSVPSSAVIISSSREIRSYRRIQTGTRMVEKHYTEKVKSGYKKVKVKVKSLGNGRFKEIYKKKPVYKNVTKTKMVSEPVYRKEPVYDTKVKYKIVTWVKSETLKKEGNDLNPIWPEFKYPPVKNPPVIGDKKPGIKHEKYLVTFYNKKKKEKIKMDKINGKKLTSSQFKKFPIGSEWKVTVDINNDVKKVEKPDNKKK